jgi:hypothetical protein
MNHAVTISVTSIHGLVESFTSGFYLISMTFELEPQPECPLRFIAPSCDEGATISANSGVFLNFSQIGAHSCLKSHPFAALVPHSH